MLAASVAVSSTYPNSSQRHALFVKLTTFFHFGWKKVLYDCIMLLNAG